MRALDPAQPVRILVGVPDEGATQIIARGEKSGYVELLDHGAVLVLLLVNRHPQCLEVRYCRRRAALGELPDIAEVNIVDQCRGEGVDLPDVRVLHAGPGTVRVARVVVWIEVRRVLELVDEIASCQPVVLPEL